MKDLIPYVLSRDIFVYRTYQGEQTSTYISKSTTAAPNNRKSVHRSISTAVAPNNRRQLIGSSYPCRAYRKKMMMKLSLFTLTLAAGTAGAFQQPQPKAPHKVEVTPAIRPGIQHNMVGAVWNSAGFGALTSPQAKYDYVCDRDYTVAAVLLSVGMWLGLFHPSKNCRSVIYF